MLIVCQSLLEVVALFDPACIVPLIDWQILNPQQLYLGAILLFVDVLEDVLDSVNVRYQLNVDVTLELLEEVLVVRDNPSVVNRTPSVTVHPSVYATIAGVIAVIEGRFLTKVFGKVLGALSFTVEA